MSNNTNIVDILTERELNSTVGVRWMSSTGGEEEKWILPAYKAQAISDIYKNLQDKTRFIFEADSNTIATTDIYEILIASLYFNTDFYKLESNFEIDSKDMIQEIINLLRVRDDTLQEKRQFLQNLITSLEHQRDSWAQWGRAKNNIVEKSKSKKDELLRMGTENIVLPSGKQKNVIDFIQQIQERQKDAEAAVVYATKMYDGANRLLSNLLSNHSKFETESLANLINGALEELDKLENDGMIKEDTIMTIMSSALVIPYMNRIYLLLEFLQQDLINKAVNGNTFNVADGYSINKEFCSQYIEAMRSGKWSPDTFMVYEAEGIYLLRYLIRTFFNGIAMFKTTWIENRHVGGGRDRVKQILDPQEARQRRQAMMQSSRDIKKMILQETLRRNIFHPQEAEVRKLQLETENNQIVEDKSEFPIWVNIESFSESPNYLFEKDNYDVNQKIQFINSILSELAPQQHTSIPVSNPVPYAPTMPFLSPTSTHPSNFNFPLSGSPPQISVHGGKKFKKNNKKTKKTKKYKKNNTKKFKFKKSNLKKTKKHKKLRKHKKSKKIIY